MTEPMLHDGEPDLDSQAAQWVVRLAGPAPNDADRQEFRDWIGRGAGEAEAFRQAQEIWSQMAGLAPAAPSGAPVVPRRRDMPRYRAVAAVSALVAAFVLIAVFVWGGTGLPGHWPGNAPARYALRQISLPDGSRVELAPGSEITPEFSATERRVVLTRGKAFFVVSPRSDTETRPFIVSAGEVLATALGTQFEVERAAGSVDVVVTEHRVQVTSGAGSDILLRESQAVHFDPKTGLGPVETIDPDLRTSWRKGRLIFDGQSLGDVISALNLYTRERIVLRGDDLAKRQVSGVFIVTDIDGAVAQIAQGLALHRLGIPGIVMILY